MSTPDQIWQQALTAALLGTDRRPFAAPDAPGALGQLLAAAPPERALLDTAAALAQYRRAGATAPQASAAPPAPSPAESAPLCGPRATLHLRQILGDQHRDLLGEWLAAASAAGVRVPPVHIPALLEKTHGQQIDRASLLAALGQRGLWLAQQHPSWRKLVVQGDVPNPQEVWETGSETARAAVLEELHRRDPTAARELLATTWSKEKADARATFAAAIGQSATMDDEPWLEGLLDDRSKEVRRVAAGLLARLPESRLAQRMRQRAQAHMELKRRLLRQPLIELRLIERFEPDMARDSIDQKPPYSSYGEKAWWFHQILLAIDPGHWNATWGASPAEIIAAAQQSEWRELLISSWREAASRFQNMEWAEALVAARQDKDMRELAAIIAIMPPAQRERVVAPLLRSDTEGISQFIRNCAHPWSEPFAREVLAHMQRLLAKGKIDWHTLDVLKNSARFFPTALAAQANIGWNTQMRDWDRWQGAVDRFLIVLHFRAEMLDALANGL